MTAPPRSQTPERALRRSWLGASAVALATLLAWWPLAPYWQSDDFLAITYASNPRRALADFAGNQYDTPALVRFYRPFITLSFAFDAWLAGAAPFWSHLSNVLAHALSTLLLTLLGHRLLGRESGLCLGLLWGLWPGHAGSISWAAGRVDSHTTVWILLAASSTLRWLDSGGARARAGALLAGASALLSKELAFGVPPLVATLGFLTAPRGARTRTAWRVVVPFALVFVAYLGVRYAALGTLVGGYQDAKFSARAALAGLGTWLARLANPLLGCEGVPHVVALAGFAPWPIALAAALARGRARALASACLLFAVCALPTAPFWAETGEGKNLRYFYLPAAALLAIPALGGRWPTALALAAAAWPFVTVRAHYFAAHREASSLHDAVRAADRTYPPGALFVHGLPRENAARDVLMFHLFTDRLLVPPFGSGRRLFALRPLVERPGVLTVSDDVCAGMPDAHTVRATARGVTAVAPAAPLLPLAIDADDLDFTPAKFWDLHLGRATCTLRFPGNRAPGYRFTLFTAGGYLATILPNTSATGDGAVEAKALFSAARYATSGDDSFVAMGLSVPAAFDLAAEFPLLVEAGDLPGDDPHRFIARARATRWLTVRLTRDYNDWLAGKIGDPRAAR